MEKDFDFPCEDAAEISGTLENVGLGEAYLTSEEPQDLPTAVGAVNKGEGALPCPPGPCVLAPDGSTPPPGWAAPEVSSISDADVQQLQHYKALKPEQCCLICYFQDPVHILLLCTMLEKAPTAKDVVVVCCKLVDQYGLPHGFLKDMDYFKAIKPFCKKVEGIFDHRKFMYYYDKFVDADGVIHLPYQDNGKVSAKAVPLSSQPIEVPAADIPEALDDFAAFLADSDLPLPDRPVLLE